MLQEVMPAKLDDRFSAEGKEKEMSVMNSSVST